MACTYSWFIVMSSLQGIYTKAYGLLLTRDSIQDKNQIQKLEEQFLQGDYRTPDRGGPGSLAGYIKF